MLDGARCDNRGEYDQDTIKRIYKNALLFGRCAFLRETCVSFLKLYFYYFFIICLCEGMHICMQMSLEA